jgi:regulation of enolase protein 1 (concanavalin A-like superfamily)
MGASPWFDGVWLNEPPHWDISEGVLTLTTASETDFWRTTSYGFVHHTGHALLVDFPDGKAVEWSVEGDFSHEFDQAGILVWAGEQRWIKCGLELADGVLGLGAVVTREVSDWSSAPVPQWNGQRVSLRVSRAGDALTIRARCEPDPWQLVRVAPLGPGMSWKVGPYAASPTREGLTVRFVEGSFTDADASLH